MQGAKSVSYFIVTEVRVEENGSATFLSKLQDNGDISYKKAELMFVPPVLSNPQLDVGATNLPIEDLQIFSPDKFSTPIQAENDNDY